jgi:hypothetical protein
MPDFHKVETATASPTMCFLCATAEGPFVDTGVNNPMIGRIYICASKGSRVGCARQIGRLDGLFEPYSVEEINSRLQDAVELAGPAINQVMQDKLDEALVATTELSDLVTKLAQTKLVPALEVYELGRAAKG